jgi:methylated-DNA-[protein]-cysteine S-methyltransferase
MHYCVFETDFGACGIAWSENGLTRLQLPEADRATTEARLCRRLAHAQAAAPPPAIAHARSLLQRYFAGERIDFGTLAVDLEGVAPFYRRIYGVAREVGWGATATYGDIAQAIGSPGAARGVGQAMGRNPVAVVIPCHRILASGNKIGGFSAFGGAVAKTRLLALEGVRIGDRPSRTQLSFADLW